MKWRPGLGTTTETSMHAGGRAGWREGRGACAGRRQVLATWARAIRRAAASHSPDIAGRSCSSPQAMAAFDSPSVRLAPLLLSLVLLLLAARPGASRDVDFCYATEYEDDRYYLFASKTAYDFVRGFSRPSDDDPHCQPEQLWILVRHGTRYPGTPNIRKMRDLQRLRDQVLRNHHEGDGRMCDDDLDALGKWSFNVREDQDNMLTEQGEQDLLLLARRLKERFPILLGQPYKSSLFKFQHTDSQRTQRSAEKFAEGLFGSSEAVVIPPALPNDTLIKPYDACPTWQSQYGGGEPPEAVQFESQQLVQELVANVSSRLGFRSPLKYEDVSTIYNTCRFDKAWTLSARSAWCAAFSNAELKVLEYAEDLRYYYKSGYGSELNVKLGCPLVRDLVHHFTALAERRDDQPAGLFYFSHSSMLHMLQSRLGVFEDLVPLRHDNYVQQRNRRWRVSKMGSFAANIAAVFYRCTEGVKERVLFLGSEGQLDLPYPGCHVGLCAWEDLRAALGPISEQCSLDFCYGENAGGKLCSPGTWLLFVATAISLLLSCSV